MKKLSLLILLLLSSCSFIKKQQQGPAKSQKKLVIVSAAPYISIVEEISGNIFDVKTIIPPDVDPHNFEPSPRDMGSLVYANLWIQVGESFEGPLGKALASIPNLKILPLQKLTKGLKSSCNHHGHHHGHDHHSDHGSFCHQNIDTHYWLDPITVATQTKLITKALISLSPEHKKEFEKNASLLRKKLNNLNSKLLKSLAPFKGDIFLTTHAAYGYFCHRYNLEQIAIEPPDGKEIRTRDVHDVLVKADQNKDRIIAILTQPQHVNRASSIIANKLHLKEIMVNPYQQNYIETIEKLGKIVLHYGYKN